MKNLILKVAIMCQTNKKALNYESSFGIPVDSSPSVFSPKNNIFISQICLLVNKISPGCGPDGIRTRTSWVRTKRTAIILPAQIPARVGEVYQVALFNSRKRLI